IDVLLIDLVDVGSRYYTFAWTAWLAIRAASGAGVHVIVLDRPNPIGGSRFEGRTQEPEYLSFVGLEPVPVRHALTIGELLAHLASTSDLPLGEAGALEIVSNDEWARGDTAVRWDRPFVPPSPNMPTADTALVYPGACLVE